MVAEGENEALARPGENSGQARLLSTHGEPGPDLRSERPGSVGAVQSERRQSKICVLFLSVLLFCMRENSKTVLRDANGGRVRGG